MKTMSVKKLRSGLFGVGLPVCSADVLPHLLDAEVPFVWLLHCRVESFGSRVQHLARGLFAKARQEIEVRCWAEFDFGLATDDFLAECVGADVETGLWDGLELFQAHRPLPQHFIWEGVSAGAELRVFRSLNIHLRFCLPHSDEYATVEACDPEVLEDIIARVKPYFETRNCQCSNAEPAAAPNGGPAASVEKPRAPGGPPSVS